MFPNLWSHCLPECLVLCSWGRWTRPLVLPCTSPYSLVRLSLLSSLYSLLPSLPPRRVEAATEGVARAPFCIPFRLTMYRYVFPTSFFSSNESSVKGCRVYWGTGLCHMTSIAFYIAVPYCIEFVCAGSEFPGIRLLVYLSICSVCACVGYLACFH